MNFSKVALISLVTFLSAHQTHGAAANWDRSLKVSGNANLANNSSVIGKPSGLLTTLGLGLDSSFSYNQQQHEWKNTITYRLAFSRDPVIKKFAKPTDQLVADSAYFYHLKSAPWFGPFARGGLEAPLLKGYDVQANTATYQITRGSGTTSESAKSLNLTDPLKPLTLKESLGAFIKPKSSELAQLEFRLGLGGRQTFSAGQLALADNAATAEIEVQELKSVYQIGSEAFGQLSGKWNSKISYKAYAEILTPFYTNKESSDSRSALDLTNYDLGTKVDLAVASWASLTHEFKALKQPQLLDKFQISTSLLLNVGFDVFASKKG